MKTKPKRHKASNTFKFQTFSERISSIDIDVFHKVKHPYEEDDEEVTHYAQTLTKWSTENFTSDYYELRKNLPNDVMTLPQLIVQKEDIMEALLNHLKSCDIDSLQPALELIVAVAKDLRKEFFPYFNPRVLQECIRLLDTREVEQIEWVFTCLAHLFKYLWGSIVKNINVILPRLLPLLSSSRPSYINNFVAESFAFVARKVRDKLQFLMLSLKNVKNNRDELVGVSKLLFEVLKGVSNQFHSCTEEFLTLVLKQLNDEKLSMLHFEICENLISFVANFVTSKTNIAPVWNTLMKMTNEFHAKWQKNYYREESESLNLLLKLVMKFINGREVVLNNPQEISDLAMNLATDVEIKNFKSLHETVVELLRCILSTNKISTKIRNTNEMIVQILGNINDEKIATHFVEKIIKMTQYECIIFREFLKFINIRGLNEYLTEFLAKIVYLKTNLSCEAEKNRLLDFYTLCLRSVPQTFTEFLVDQILDEISEKNIHLVESSLHSVIVLSYTNIPTVEFIKKSDEFLSNLCVRIETEESTELRAKLLYSLLITVQYRSKFRTTDDSNINKVIVLAAKYVNCSDYLCSLRILYSLAENNAFECLNSDREKLRLIENLSSPFHKVRLFSSHVLSKMNIDPIFNQISEIETIYPSIETYRDKLQRLQEFECNELFVSASDKYVRLGALKFLFGNMYINFLYMWEPTQKLIRSHLENDPNAWSVFIEELKKISANDLNCDEVMEDMQAQFKCEFLKEHFYQLNGVDDRPDFYNVRCLLLNVMTDAANSSYFDKNFVAEHFLIFYRSEYTAGNNNCGAYCNVKLAKQHVFEEDIIEKGTKSDKNYNKLFLIYLKLIGNFASQLPKQFKSDVFDIHFELLSNGNSDIQKYAVNFICHIKNMNSYKERLILLTNDKTIKDQLLNIRIDLNSNTIPEQDVPYLMKIILKILFGKVRKKSASNLRDAMFEFLMSCKRDDIIFFFDMIFTEFSAAVKDPSDPVICRQEEINIEKTISPSWILNYLNHAAEILKKCGSLLQATTLKYLLRILFKCISSVVFLYSQKSLVHPCYHNLISKIRVNAFETIMYFLENFTYAWSKEEVNALFKFFVDPWIEKVSEECLQSPNPLMKLFIAFTKNPKFFPLLAKKSKNLTAMDVLMGLLNNDKVYFNVKNSLVDIVERLLTLEDEIDEEEMREFMCHDVVHSNRKKKNQRYGTILLMPYVSQVLQYLQASLSKRYIKLNGVYMLILKRISEFGLDEEAGSVLLSLLLPILRMKIAKGEGDDDVVVPLLDTILNLFRTFKNHNRFEEYLLQIAYLFGIATAQSVRLRLCELVSYISNKTEKKFIDSGLICGLNLDDKKWIGQPDYDGRLKTFRSINAARDSEEISVYTGIFIVYNCFYTIKIVKDIALRDHSGLCLKKLCPSLCAKYSDNKKELNLFLNDILLPLIREGILSDDENYQHESLTLLGHMARECSGVHFVFRDLHPLIDSKDIETDFFENILHLQHFRRIKALKRFAEIMSQQTKAPTPYTLSFLTPLVTRSLLSPKFSNEHGLIDAAIESLGVICRLSTWRHYERTLKFYIMEMRKNVALRKQAVRIVSVILDSFHFDISQADQTNAEQKSDKAKSEDDAELMEEDEEAEDTAEEVEDKQLLPIVRRMTVLCRSDATRVYRSIKSFLIPSLDRIFMTYDDSEQYHKQSKKDTKNDKEEMAVLSIPIAYAAVKLMQKLPKTVLEEYISTIFLKLSTYLKSRLTSIRLIARETMQNILMEIGPKFLPRLLSEMMSVLTKGFQIHVLVFTCHAILEKVKHLFVENEIDLCVDPILEICIVDLFGKLSEEKEVTKIIGKTPEAKGNKSYHMLNILSEHISRCHVLDMIVPLKQILGVNMSTKTVNKVRRCLQYIALGLVKNKFIDTVSILELAYGVSNDCIPELTCKNQNNKVRIESEKYEKSDTLLLPEEPRKLKPELTKTSARTNAHVIIEFGLELLESTLRQEQLKPNAYRERLDPFMLIIKDCLHSQHMKLRILSLKCLVKLFRKKLPSLNDSIDDICYSIFEILSEFSNPAMTGDNAELRMAAAKAALVLVHDLDHKIDESQLGIMLMVAEDLLKHITHYGTGFSLIRAAIKRKFNIPAVHKLMMNILELSIRSYSEPVRTMAREVYFKYLMNYPHGKKLRGYVEFVVDQLKYDQLDGRKSALELLKMLLKEIPLELLSDLANTLHFALACRLELEESAECKQMVADCLRLMIERFKGTKGNDKMLETVMIWIEEPKISVRRLALQILGLYVSTLESECVDKLDLILPLIERQLSSGTPRPPLLESSNSVVEKDHLIFQTLHLYKMIFEKCPEVLTSDKYVEHVDKIGVSSRIFLSHSHEWIRLEAAQILRMILKRIQVKDVANALQKTEIKRNTFLCDDNAKEMIKSLCLDFCDQLAPGCDVMKQLMKETKINLLYFVEVLKEIKESDPKKLSLLWLIKKLTKQVTLEVAKAPQKYTVRTMVFKLFRELAGKSKKKILSLLLPTILTPVVRELETDDEQGAKIRELAETVRQECRNKIPTVVYDKVITEVQRQLNIKKTKRKITRAQKAVTDPEKTANAKVKKQLKKKEQKKRRLEKLRKRKFKSGKRIKLVDVSAVRGE